MTRGKRNIILIVAAVLLAGGGYIAWLGYQVVQAPKNAYAAWWAADLVIEHMEKHQGAWPRSWAEIRATCEQAGISPTTSIEELQQRVEIDWNADPKELVKAEFKDEEARPPFRVIWLRNGGSTHWLGREPNNMVLEYLKQKEKEVAAPRRATGQ